MHIIEATLARVKHTLCDRCIPMLAQQPPCSREPCPVPNFWTVGDGVLISWLTSRPVAASPPSLATSIAWPSLMSAVLAGSFLSPCLICPTASALITAVTARIAALWHVLCSPALSNPSPTRSTASPRAALISNAALASER